jgi:predicted DNA-binding protein
MSKYFGIRIPDDMDGLLADLSKSTNQPKSFHVKKAIENYLEDFFDYMDAVAIMNNSEGTYTLDEVKKRLGLTS